MVTAGLAVMAVGAALRVPVALYRGPADQGSFNTYLFGHMGSYSDIASLYFRDHLWTHPLPYVDYPLEYPVGTGLVVWLLGFVHGSVAAYLFSTLAVLIGAGVVTIALGDVLPGSNMWLLALSPLLALELPVNWDMLGILATVAALVLFVRDRDAWSGIALSAGIWLKFFPVVLLPVFVAIRLLQGRPKDAWKITWITAVASIAVNEPFAIDWRSGVHLRDGWTWFFRYSAQRGREVNLWNAFDWLHPSISTINWGTLAALAVGLVVLIAVIRRSRRRGSLSTDLVVPAALALMAWLFFLGKVYSPQYGLWIMALLALAGAPVGLAVAFAAVDAAYFLVSFLSFKVGSYGAEAGHSFYVSGLLPAMAVREAVILTIAAYGVWRLWRRTPA